MKDRYILIRRSNGVYYIEDTESTPRKRKSLGTKCKKEATEKLLAENKTARDPRLARSIAISHLRAANPELLEITWQDVGDRVEKRYTKPSSKKRWQKFMKTASIQPLLGRRLVDTYFGDFEAIFNDRRTGVTAFKQLQTLHTYALDTGLLLERIVPRGKWPKYKSKKKKPITPAMHAQILNAEKLEEYRRFYKFLWETGCSQSDAANLRWDHVHKKDGQIRFQRAKLQGEEDGGQTCIPIGWRIREILLDCPTGHYLFPHLQPMEPATRASHFAKVCKRAGIPKGITLHCYRYGWAFRAKEAGMPLREAMKNLGHKSAAIHEAYAGDLSGFSKPLEEYEGVPAPDILIPGDDPEGVFTLD